MVDRLVAFLVEAHLSASGFPQKGGLGLSSAVLSTNIRFSKDFPLPPLFKWRLEINPIYPGLFWYIRYRGGHIVPPLSILGLGGVRVPILFGNDLPMND